MTWERAVFRPRSSSAREPTWPWLTPRTLASTPGISVRISSHSPPGSSRSCAGKPFPAAAVRIDTYWADAGGQVGHPDEPRVDGGVDVAVAQPGEHRPGDLGGVRDRQRGTADLPRVGPGDHPGRRRRALQGGPGDRRLPFSIPGLAEASRSAASRRCLAAGGAAGQPGEQSQRRRAWCGRVGFGFGATDTEQDHLPPIVRPCAAFRSMRWAPRSM